MMAAGKLPLDCRNDDEDYSKLIRALIFAEPQRLIMDDPALVIMNGLREHLFNLEQACVGLGMGFQTFVGKLHSVAGSLALLLHMAHDPKEGATYSVGEKTAADVRRLMLNFILPHALEFYCGSATAESERLRSLASWILTSNVREFRGLTLQVVNERVSPSSPRAGFCQRTEPQSAGRGRCRHRFRRSSPSARRLRKPGRRRSSL